MGIPVFFKTLVEDYHDLLLPMNHQRVNHNLFLDLNCLIHPCCNEVAKFDPKEDLMISNIIHKINKRDTFTFMYFLLIQGFQKNILPANEKNYLSFKFFCCIA